MFNTKKAIPKAGLLINKAGTGRYCSQNSVGRLIRYIARENGTHEDDDLICTGAIGATNFTNIDTTIQQFECVQLLHTRQGNFGRYIDHEIYSFSPAMEKLITENNISNEKLAKEMASDFYKDGFQVYYGVHKKDSQDKHLHIHFAINTVNFRTGMKRHENITDTQNREKRLEHIIANAIMPL
jgi:hypothetical protein